MATQQTVPHPLSVVPFPVPQTISQVELTPLKCNAAQRLLNGGEEMKASIAKFEVIKGGRQSEDWREMHSELDFDDLVRLQDRIRALAVWLDRFCRNEPTAQAFAHVLERMEQELKRSILPFPGLWDEGDESWSLTTKILRNLGRVLPTESNLEMLVDFMDRLEEREKELKRPHLVLSRMQSAGPRRRLDLRSAP